MLATVVYYGELAYGQFHSINRDQAVCSVHSHLILQCKTNNYWNSYEKCPLVTVWLQSMPENHKINSKNGFSFIDQESNQKPVELHRVCKFKQGKK